YPYDLNRAQSLLADAGWRKAPDGIFRNAAGDPFAIDVSASMKTDNVAEAQVLSSQWKDAGLNTSVTIIPDKATNRDELRATFSGVLGWPLQRTVQVGDYFVSSQIPTAANNWKLNNSGGYSNPTYDDIYGRYLTTLQVPQR